MADERQGRQDTGSDPEHGSDEAAADEGKRPGEIAYPRPKPNERLKDYGDRAIRRRQRPEREPG